ncbi:MAG: glycine zipper 2TM domain-containing protein [Sphingomonadales bacterium]|nr:glycine zipper 2TM domain-containing protein [Sphingomonadales bacterium]
MDDLSRQIRWQRRDGDDRYGNRDAIRDDSRFATNYDAARYYRDDPRYPERRLSDQDEVYRGSDGRYYCKRSDGTTGLIVGAIGGGVLGNVIDGGRNRVGGTLIGGALGALLGSAIDRNSSNNDIRCR